MGASIKGHEGKGKGKADYKGKGKRPAPWEANPEYIKKTVICHKCGKPGHIARDCKSKRKWNDDAAAGKKDEVKKEE